MYVINVSILYASTVEYIQITKGRENIGLLLPIAMYLTVS